MIIYNSISPLNKFLVGQYQFYYPNAEDLVGLQLIDNKWVYRPNIDARNAPDVHDNYDPTKKKQLINCHHIINDKIFSTKSY